jgi:hypothetical protein
MWGIAERFSIADVAGSGEAVQLHDGDCVNESNSEQTESER